MSENNFCPCCGRHCDLSAPHCPRGEEYARTGVISEDNHGHEHKHEHGYGCEHRHRHGCGHNKYRNVGQIENYDKLDTDNKLIMNLRDLGHMIRFLFEGKGSQKRILIILLENESITQRELTERLRVKPGSASEVIGKLESAGLIERCPSKTDRRTADIKLTESGRLRAEEAAKQRKMRHTEMFSCLSDEEKDTLLTLIEKLNTYWDSHYNHNEYEHHKIHEKGHCQHRHNDHHGGENRYDS